MYVPQEHLFFDAILSFDVNVPQWVDGITVCRFVNSYTILG